MENLCFGRKKRNKAVGPRISDVGPKISSSPRSADPHFVVFVEKEVVPVPVPILLISAGLLVVEEVVEGEQRR